jgi:hypothetical protein
MTNEEKIALKAACVQAAATLIAARGISKSGIDADVPDCARCGGERNRASFAPPLQFGRRPVKDQCSAQLRSWGIGARLTMGLSRRRPRARWPRQSDVVAPQRAADGPYRHTLYGARAMRDATADRPSA